MKQRDDARKARVLAVLAEFWTIYHRPAAWSEIYPRCRMGDAPLRRILGLLVAERTVTYTRRAGWQPYEEQMQ